MNFAHLHLVVNHISVVGIPLVLLFLSYGVIKNSLLLQNFSLAMLTFVSLCVLPAYFSGESAEEVVEHLPGVAESSINPHEEAAELSLILCLMTSAASVVALWFHKKVGMAQKINIGVICLALLAWGFLIYTANLGGKIRHSELRSDPAETSSSYSP